MLEAIAHTPDMEILITGLNPLFDLLNDQYLKRLPPGAYPKSGLLEVRLGKRGGGEDQKPPQWVWDPNKLIGWGPPGMKTAGVRWPEC